MAHKRKLNMMVGTCLGFQEFKVNPRKHGALSQKPNKKKVVEE